VQLNTSVLIYIAILIGAMAFVEGVYLLVSDWRKKSGTHVNRRLRLMARNSPGEGALELLRPKPLGEGASPWLQRLLSGAPIQAFDSLVATSGINLSSEQALLYMTSAAVIIFWLLDLFTNWAAIWCVLLGVAVGLVIPLYILVRIRRSRMARISLQLSDALDMIVRSLKAGHPAATGIEMVAREMPDPIGTEFGLVFDGMSYGLDLRDALEKMGLRLRVPEIDYMIVAMRIQSGTGGNLAEILSSLSNVMRDRQKLFGKVKALSAEARLSAKILAMLPIAVVGLLLVINPHYYDKALTDPLLMAVLIFAVFLSVAGMVLMRGFVNIRA
jgi:tight adherence protein B